MRPSRGPGTPIDVAEYIGTLLGQMREMTTRCNLDLLGHLLALAQCEAKRVTAVLSVAAGKHVEPQE